MTDGLHVVIVLDYRSGIGELFDGRDGVILFCHLIYLSSGLVPALLPRFLLSSNSGAEVFTTLQFSFQTVFC